MIGWYDTQTLYYSDLIDLISLQGVACFRRPNMAGANTRTSRQKWSAGMDERWHGS